MTAFWKEYPIFSKLFLESLLNSKAVPRQPAPSSFITCIERRQQTFDKLFKNKNPFNSVKYLYYKNRCYHIPLLLNLHALFYEWIFFCYKCALFTFIFFLLNDNRFTINSTIRWSNWSPAVTFYLFSSYNDSRKIHVCPPQTFFKETHTIFSVLRKYTF